jgi:hypothetical protein
VPMSARHSRFWLWSSRSRSRWVEWGPFVLAVIIAVGALIALATTSPIFSGPRPLPGSDPIPGQVSAPSAPDASPQDEDAAVDPPVS